MHGAHSILGLWDGLQNLLTCPVCGNYHKDPITMFSGNTVCQSCYPQECPPAGLNWRIRRIVTLFKEMKPLLEQPQPVPEGWCPKHDEPFTLLCQEDNQRICYVCQYSSLHSKHTLTKLEDPKAREASCEEENEISLPPPGHH
uniref:E3 ubiquitin-protein ligase TRIM4-like isoform X1 n=1 Tax=Phascolarctos cinereus TaxID=38626 RepID=A0A6P5LMM1_PHACI|nr:E3 ubiquitin-protein ligase TRIM4-like isoform X1 [Phascolarctos cinereus]